jgi:hypothetical protein
VVVHRSLGYLLLLLAIPFAFTGLYIAVRDPFFAPIGELAAVIAGLLFIHVGVRAYLAIKAGDRINHRNWMLRFLALAYAIAVIRALALVVMAFIPIGPERLARRCSGLVGPSACCSPNGGFAAHRQRHRSGQLEPHARRRRCRDRAVD